MSGESMSLRELGLLAYNLGEPIKPIQRDYGPWDALMISSGAATQSAMDQARRAYLLARISLAGRWQGPEEVAQHRAELKAMEAQRAENDRLYQPLRDAYGMTTAAGESFPAFVAGRGNGLSTLRFNVGRALLDETARDSVTLQQLANGLRAY
jgi:hypothetical protein